MTPVTVAPIILADVLLVGVSAFIGYGFGHVTDNAEAGFTVVGHDDEGEACIEGTVAGIDEVRDAIERIRNEPGLAAGIRYQFEAVDADDWDYDAEGAAAVLQVAAFERVVFG